LEDLTSPCLGLQNVGLRKPVFLVMLILGHSFITNVSPRKVKLANKFQLEHHLWHQQKDLKLRNASKNSHNSVARKEKI